MPIKKIHVGFDIDMDVFMKMLQHGSSGVRVDFLGDMPKERKEKKQPKLLEAPRVGAKNVMMNLAKGRKEEGFKPKELVPLISAAGYSDNTHSPILMWLSSRGFLTKRKDGTYFPTAKGMTYGEA